MKAECPECGHKFDIESQQARAVKARWAKAKVIVTPPQPAPASKTTIVPRAGLIVSESGNLLPPRVHPNVRCSPGLRESVPGLTAVLSKLPSAPVVDLTKPQTKQRK